MPRLDLPVRTLGVPHADAELIARAARGEADAFAQIMRRHNRLLFRSARGVVHDDAEAQDIVQETYLRAFSMLGAFRGEAALGTWLARIAIHVALDARRKLARTVSLDAAMESPAALPSDPSAVDPPRFDAPEASTERRQLRALLQGAIDSLPPIYRSVFILRAVEEMSVEQTAFCLQVSEELVKTRYLRARAKLRDALGARLEADLDQTFGFAGAQCDAVVAQVLIRLARQGRLDVVAPI